MRALRNGVERCLEYVVILAVGALVLDVLWGVFSRFLLNEPSRWTEEVATYLLVWVSFLGAAIGFRRKQHLGVDYFVQQLDFNAQRLVAIVVQGIVAAFAGSAMVWGGYVLVSETLAAGQLTPALGIRMGYVYLAVPLSGIFIVLYSLELMWEQITGTSTMADQMDIPSSESLTGPASGPSGN